MGIGDPLEAAFTLVGPLGAGTWTLVGDGIIIEPVDVRFEVFVRAEAGGETPLFSADHHFDPRGGGNFDAVPFETRADAPAVAAASGDRLVFRYSAMNATVAMSYIPNGDGASANGRIPSLTLP